MTVSAAEGAGLPEAWEKLTHLDQWRRDQGWRDQRRAEQGARWMRFELEEGLKAAFSAHPAVAATLPEAQARVVAGASAPEAEAEALLSLFLGAIETEPR